MAGKANGHTLLIMAAGRGSRFGGLKQLEPVGPHGEAIMEYSIHSALASGFTRVALVVRPEYESLFRERIVDRIGSQAPVVLVHQEVHAGSPGYPWPADREKPWGTAHAVLAARDAIHGTFAVVNADDFYGPRAIRSMGDYLGGHVPSQPLEGAMVGYRLRNTLSARGAVARGVCERDSGHWLTGIVEYRKVVRQQSGEIVAEGEAGNRVFSGAELVSLNLWGFPPGVFRLLENQFTLFLSGSPARDQEFEIPTVVNRLIEAGDLRVRVMDTDEQWCGVTYRDDIATVQSRLASLIESGVYPEQLWGNY